MAEQQTLKVGQVVSFKGYTNLEEGVAPLLAEGDRIMIMKINDGETDDDQEFEVRPVDEKGAVIPNRDGDMLFSDEFNVMTPVTEPAPAKKTKAKAKAAPKVKAKTKRQIAKEAAVEKAEAKAAAKVLAEAKVVATKAAKVAKVKARAKAAIDAETSTKKVKTKTTTDADTESDTPVVDYTHDPAVKALLRKSNNIVEVASTLAAQHEEIYFKLGGVLAKIHGDNMHIAAGFEDTADGFDAYVNANIGGLGKRKAYYLIKIYRHLRRAGITSMQLKTIGWTKARALSKVPVEDLNDEWLEKARTQTRNDLEAEIKSSYVNAGDTETAKRTIYRFVLIGDANTLVERAIEYSKNECGDVNANAAFENLCTQYLALNENLEGAATGLPMTGDELTEYAAEKLGLDITVMGPVDSEAGDED